MAGSGPFRAVLAMLEGCYADVLGLEQFVQRLREAAACGPGEAELLQRGDSELYRTFVSRCVVCVPRGARAIPQPLSFQQLSSESEVVIRVIQRLCEKKKKNVLAFGYALLDENSSYSQVMSTSNICSYLPNTATETLRMSVLWETLLSRIGDDIMMYLLEHCAIFMLVPPSCSYQICGQPMYELTSSNAGPSTVFVKQRYSKSRHNILFDYMQKKCQLSKTNRWKWKPRSEINILSTKSQRNNKTQGSAPDYEHSATAKGAVGQNSKANKQVRMVTGNLENLRGPNLYPVATATPSKRKLDRDQFEVTAKRMKINLREEEDAWSFGSNVDKNKFTLDIIYDAQSLSCVESFSVNNFIKIKSISQENEGRAETPDAPSLVQEVQDSKEKSVTDDENSLRLHVQRNKLYKSSTDTKTNSSREGVELDICKFQVGSVQMKKAEDKFLKYRGLKCPPTNIAKKLSNKISRSRVYIGRKCLLYSSRSFQECFPKSFLLNRLKGCQAGGQQLVETIFLNSKMLAQKCSENIASYNWRKKRLPKRYWQMRDVFQKLLKNHAKCPYLVLLKKNCPVWISETNSSKTDTICQSVSCDRVQIDREAEGQVGKEPPICLTSNSREGGYTDVPNGSCLLSKRTSTDLSILSSPEKFVLGQTENERQNAKEFCDPGLKALLRQHSSHWQVYVFVRECLDLVVPEELWGSSYNKCRFLKNVKTFISLGKFARFSLQELMWKMRVNDCTWLRVIKENMLPRNSSRILVFGHDPAQLLGDHFVPALEHHYREEILAKFLYWLMDTYIVQLLRSFFYITETMFQKNMLFFYRKLIWSKLQNIGMRNHFAKVHLRALSAEEIEKVQQKKCVPMASKLRFIPKPNGLRPIVKVNSVVGAKTLNRKSRDKKVHYFNTQLKNLFSVLNYERTENTSLLGSSVFGKDDIYKIWRKFVSEVLESNDKIPRFYYVKADVTGAYDTIPHDKLVEVVSQILDPEKRTVYCIRRYAVIKITMSGQIRKYYRRHVSTFKDFMSHMRLFVSHLQESTSLQNAIVVEQGSILSTLLCSLCYGDMENKLFCGIQRDGVLIRLIDDFLLLTPHLTLAKTFLRTLATGIPEYGFLINPKKTVMNFPVDEDIPGCSEFKQLPYCGVIPWCGLLLDIQTLEVYCDYSSYACTSIRSSLSFNSSSTAGKNMKYKLVTVLKLKCHSLFLNLQINSLRTVFMNIYKIFLLQAYRFHACVLQLPFNQQVRKNPCFFLRIISDTASCCYSILKTKNTGIALGTKGASGLFPSEAAEWLCYHAFIIKLTNHKVVYKCLLRSLKICELQLFKKIPKATMQLLKTVTEPALCKDFKAIMD
ncbi:telomerase reverse transcriptase isoform X5 [Dermochelys coriacea]|uniref:telomerase reverse transcriptase isoform X5 n=1 Tax=Dermochelys coriacea TaxID=27794 RepID=UPI001CA97598|nr:telomerase reverse transcriptase isoform X5 [Dermochelys coriacea]